MLKSPRLVYNQFQKEDFSDFLSWYGNEKVMRMVAGKALSMEEAKSKFTKVLEQNKEDANSGFFSVSLESNNEFIAVVKFSFLEKDMVEIGYGSLPEYWFRGYATEMLEAILNHARSMPKIRSLVGIVNPKNKNSIKVLKRQNFKLNSKTKNNEEALLKYILEF